MSAAPLIVCRCEARPPSRDPLLHTELPIWAASGLDTPHTPAVLVVCERSHPARVEERVGCQLGPASTSVSSKRRGPPPSIGSGETRPLGNAGVA